jgi:hypothetical protein
MREQIASLNPPEHFAGKHASLLDVFDSRIETTRDLVEAARRARLSCSRSLIA